MRWLVTGAAGALGTDLLRVLRAAGEPVTALARAELDITDGDAVSAAVSHWVAGQGRVGDRSGDERAVLLNAAAFTAVDLAETDPDAARAAHAANAVAPGLLAAACAAAGAEMVHVSTDYVFRGDRSDGRGYRPEDPIDPRSVYGRTKAEGEQRVRDALDAHHVVRTAWVYGGTGANFVRTMARLAGEREVLDVVDDQHGSPTWSADLAAGLVDLVRAGSPPGTRHLTGGGHTTWCGLAREVFSVIGADPRRVRGCTTDQFPRPAPRPAWSVLANGSDGATGSAALRAWPDALRAAAHTHPELFGIVRA